MYYSTYSPPHDDNADSDLTEVSEQIFSEIQANTFPDNEDFLNYFSTTVLYPQATMSCNLSPRQKLKAVVNNLFSLADKIGGIGVSRLEETMTEFNE